MIDFSTLEPGNRVRVLGFKNCNAYYRQHLLAMGLTRGATFTVLRKAPLGDPVAIKIRGFTLSLRKEEANSLELERLNDE